MSIYKAIKNRSYKEPNRRIFFTQSYWEVEYSCGGFNILFFRAARGSLVKISRFGKPVAEWVDQSEQYTLLGINDLLVHDKFQFVNLKKAKPAF